MYSFLSSGHNGDSMNIAGSKLYDQKDFYNSFVRDLERARTLVVIESPFMTQKRINMLLPALERLRLRGVTVIVNTKPIEEHEALMANYAEQGINQLQGVGVRVMMTVGHHRKLAIIDDVLWEGSLNILSQHDSCEFMRRISSRTLAQEMLSFIGVRKWV